MLAANVLADIAKNIAMGVPALRAARLRFSRTARAPDQAGIERYIGLLAGPVFDLCAGVEGKSVLEIGPGDNLVTGLAFLAFGARSYTAIDRFPGAYRSARAQAWYAALAQYFAQPVPSIDDPRITVIEGAVERIGNIGSFDIICSLAVGEHVTSVSAFANFTCTSLRPGGTAVHVVDFSGHHWHRDADPDLFRRFPEWLWHAMGSNRGLPNRVHFADYLTYFEEVGLKVTATLDGTHAVITARHTDPFTMTKLRTSASLSDPPLMLRTLMRQEPVDRASTKII